MDLSYLNSGLEIVIVDERTDRKQVFKFEGGIATYVADLNANKTAMSDVIAFSGAVGGGGTGERAAHCGYLARTPARWAMATVARGAPGRRAR